MAKTIYRGAYIITIIIIFLSGCSNSDININDGVLRNESGDSIIVNNSIPTHIKDPKNNNIAGVDINGRLDIVEHAHPYQTAAHFHVQSLTPGTYRYILASTNLTNISINKSIEYFHIEWIEIQVDSNVNGNYAINFGFIENVTNISSNRYIVKHFDGSKTTGQQLLEFANFYPNGWRMDSDKIITHAINMGDIYYNTSSNLPSSYNPINATITPSNGDMILEIVLNAGEINVAFDVGYHPDIIGTD